MAMSEADLIKGLRGQGHHVEGVQTHHRRRSALGDDSVDPLRAIRADMINTCARSGPRSSKNWRGVAAVRSLSAYTPNGRVPADRPRSADVHDHSAEKGPLRESGPLSTILKPRPVAGGPR